MMESVYQFDYPSPSNYKSKYFSIPYNVETIKKQEKAKPVVIKKEIPKKTATTPEDKSEWSTLGTFGLLLKRRIVSPESQEKLIETDKNTETYSCKYNPDSELEDIVRTNYPSYKEAWTQAFKRSDKRICPKDLNSTHRADYKFHDQFFNLSGLQCVVHEEKTIPKITYFKKEKLGASDTKTYDLSYLTDYTTELSMAEKKRAPVTDMSINKLSGGGAKLLKQYDYFTEYVGNISKVGCLIMKNNIHDHKNCPFNCRHRIMKPCGKLKNVGLKDIEFKISEKCEI